MTAQEARKMTDIANSQSRELARIYKKIEKGVPFNLMSENKLNAEEWFEQFKKD